MKRSLIFSGVALFSLLVSGCNLMPTPKKKSSSVIPNPSGITTDSTGGSSLGPTTSDDSSSQDISSSSDVPPGPSSSSSSSVPPGPSSSSSSITPPPSPIDPDTYYSGISDSLTGKTLKTALYKLIKITSKILDYDDLFDVYRKSDVRPDGEHFWDIYSDKTDYTLYDSRINHSYSEEGDSLNREHMIPQSIFNEAYPMKADPHHVLPSDGYVNNRRSNFPHDDLTSVTWTSKDGFKLGYYNKVQSFEPKAKYKGDIARIMFYFITCYQEKISSFKSYAPFDKDTNDLTTHYVEVYLKWHLEDPVDSKETIRNDAITEFQPNRNPFIDRPQYACKIWGERNSTTKTLCGIK